MSALRPSPRRAVLAAIAAASAGAAWSVRAQTPDGWPALPGATGEIQHGKWVWNELLCADPEAAAAFYESVFGWRATRRGVGSRAYRLVQLGDRPVAGIVRAQSSSDARPASGRWVGLMSVPDLDATLVRANASGGKTLFGPVQQLGRGRVALLADPEGTPFGVIRAVQGDPADREVGPGEFLWQELWAGEGARMAAFYRQLGNYTLRRVSAGGDRDEWLLATGETPRAGVIEKGDAAVRPTWLPYLRVTDLSATLRAVESAGGRVLVAPSPQRRGGRVAIVADVSGAPLGLAVWSAGGKA
jgi:uncharacterized protein